MRIPLLMALVLIHWVGFAQPAVESPSSFHTIAKVPATPVKNQAATGTCWSFSTTSLVETEGPFKGKTIDISEMFTVRNIYVEKAKNYILRQGVAQFGQGGLGHDVIRSIDRYGAVPESAYSGLMISSGTHDHTQLEIRLKTFLDSLLARRPIPSRWETEYTAILDSYLGKVPETFIYQEKVYTPQSFASEVLQFNATDFVNITSFTHHPYYEAFILEVPDNFSNGTYYNLPLEEMLDLVDSALKGGYSVMWDADVSNPCFRQKEGLALYTSVLDRSVPLEVKMKELPYDAAIRQALFENLTTQDDHLMHLIGLEKDEAGRAFYLVKNSWGEDAGPYHGYIHVSRAYFAINTISLVLPKAALSGEFINKLGLK